MTDGGHVVAFNGRQRLIKENASVFIETYPRFAFERRVVVVVTQLERDLGRGHGAIISDGNECWRRHER